MYFKIKRNNHTQIFLKQIVSKTNNLISEKFNLNVYHDNFTKP